MSGKRITKGLLDRLVERLMAAGVLGEERSKVLGLRRWPTVDPRREEEIRSRLQSSLVGDDTPTERTVALIALLQITGQLTKVVSTRDPKAVKAKAKALTEGDWAAAAVKQAIDEVYAMMAAMVAVSAAVRGGGGSGSGAELHPGRAGVLPGRRACPTWSVRACGCSSSASIPACGPRRPRPTSPTRATASIRRCGWPASSIVILIAPVA